MNRGFFFGFFGGEGLAEPKPQQQWEPMQQQHQILNPLGHRKNLGVGGCRLVLFLSMAYSHLMGDLGSQTRGCIRATVMKVPNLNH